MERVVIAMVETKAGEQWGRTGLLTPSEMGSARATSGRRTTPLLSADELQVDHRGSIQRGAVKGQGLRGFLITKERT